MKRFFVAGIGTDVGKTVASAILCEALGADYWKPVQSGGLDHTDTDEVRSLVGNPSIRFHRETYRLPFPLSPHASAENAGIVIDPQTILMPDTANTLIIEGAGGMMVPLNNTFLMIDLLAHFDAETILVSRNYLGSINHTLLTWEVLRGRNLKIKGIIFNGEENIQSENFIMGYTRLKKIGRIPHAEKVSRQFISEQAFLIASAMGE